MSRGTFHGKDDAASLRARAEEQLQASAEGAIYVGDSPVDIQAGAAAGMATAAVAWGVFGREALMAVAPDFWVEAPHELLDLCLRGRPTPGRLGET